MGDGRAKKYDWGSSQNSRMMCEDSRHEVALDRWCPLRHSVGAGLLYITYWHTYIPGQSDCRSALVDLSHDLRYVWSLPVYLGACLAEAVALRHSQFQTHIMSSAIPNSPRQISKACGTNDNSSRDPYVLALKPAGLKYVYHGKDIGCSLLLYGYVVVATH